jgi:hypothetical protein
LGSRAAVSPIYLPVSQYARGTQQLTFVVSGDGSGPMAGLELVAGYLAAWVMRKARRAAGRVDGDIDQALDLAMDRLYALVFSKLGADPALARLQADAQRGVEDPRTHKRVQLAVEDAVDQDPRFAAELGQLLQQVQALGAPGVGNATRVRADRKGMAAGGDIIRGGRHNQVGHRFGALGAVIVVLIGSVTFLYYLNTHGGPPADEVAYQQQVLATCKEAYGVLSADRSTEYVRNPPTATDFEIDKAALLDVMRDDLAQVKAAFAHLGQREVPPSLRDRKKAVDQAFTRWVASFQQEIRTAQAKVPDGMDLFQFNQTFRATVQGKNPDVTLTRLASAMNDLAGKHCP